jgi:hypothetical protein
MENAKKYLTVKQFVEANAGGWPASESAIRAIILDASWGKNNFQSAFKRVNRRVLVDPIEFWKCVEDSQLISKK